jgi:hypothetical protein
VAGTTHEALLSSLSLDSVSLLDLSLSLILLGSCALGLLLSLLSRIGLTLSSACVLTLPPSKTSLDSEEKEKAQ